MLMHLLLDAPRMLATIVAKTPSWVWLVLAALLLLGASQCVARSASLQRTLLMPAAMSVFSVWSLHSAFGHAQHLLGILVAWLAVAATTAALLLWVRRAPATGVRFNAEQRRFQLPGSGWPLLLILGIFLVKWSVGVELALQPSLSHDSPFALQIAVGYGVINGLFTARAARLLLLARAGERTRVGACANAPL